MPTASQANGSVVTFINFGAGERGAAGADRPVPGGCEQGGVRAAPQAVGALAAHAHGAGGQNDATGAGERFEEIELAANRPTVMPDGQERSG